MSDFRHDGFYLRFGYGLSYLYDSIQVSRGVLTGQRLEAYGLGFSPLMLTLGGSLAPGLVLAAALEFHLIGSPALRLSGRKDTTPNGYSIGLGSFGVSALWYPNPNRGLFGEADLSTLSFDQSDDSHDAFADPSGVIGGLGVGYEWWIHFQWSVGFMTRLLVGAGQGRDGLNEQQHVMVLPTLNAFFTYH